MNCIDSVINYFHQSLSPKIQEITSLDEIVVAIGGSVSYGFADEYSDVDVYIICELPREVWFGKLRQYLFMHRMIDGFRIQFIPLMLQSAQYSSLSYLYHEELEKLKDCDMKLLFDIQHFIPVHDSKNLINRSKTFVSNLEKGFWERKCVEHCSKHIDTLETFYSSLKRDNIVTGSMYFGDALKGLLQIVYLSAGLPYPSEKWIWNGLKEVDVQVSEAISMNFINGFPGSCEELRNCINNIVLIVAGRLKEKGFVPSRIIEDLLSP